jgi:hypothetical protein
MDDWEDVINRREIRHKAAQREPPPFPRYEVMMAGIVAVIAIAILFLKGWT